MARRKVRVGRDETYAEVYARLTRAQQDAMDRVVEAHRQTLATQTLLETQQAMLARCVFQAMVAGTPARLLAERLAVTPSRVYQIRDQVLGWGNGTVPDEGTGWQDRNSRPGTART